MHTLELLNVGVEQVPEGVGNKWLAPDGMAWAYELRDGMPWYALGWGGYSYSWEETGIQLLFEDTMEADDVLRVAEAIVRQLRSMGHNARLLVIDTQSGAPVAF